METKNYFTACETELQVKARFKSLSKKWHPDKNKDPKAKEIFQEINNQREDLLKKIWRALGITEADINSRLDDFLKEYLLEGKKGGVEKMGEILGKEFYEQHPDKEPTLADMFKFVSGKVLGALNGGALEGKDQKKIGK